MPLYEIFVDFVLEHVNTTTVTTSMHNLYIYIYICKFTRVASKLIYAVPTVTYGGYIKNFTVGLTQKQVTQSRDFRKTL